MAEVVSQRPLTSEARKRSQVSQSEICGEGSNSRTGLSRSTSVFPCLYYSTDDSYSSSSACCSYQKDKRTKSGNLLEVMPFRKSGCVGQKRTFAFISAYANLQKSMLALSCMSIRPSIRPYTWNNSTPTGGSS
jgi:hypothetical protein